MSQRVHCQVCSQLAAPAQWPSGHGTQRVGMTTTASAPRLWVLAESSAKRPHEIAMQRAKLDPTKPTNTSLSPAPARATSVVRKVSSRRGHAGCKESPAAPSAAHHRRHAPRTRHGPQPHRTGCPAAPWFAVHLLSSPPVAAPPPEAWPRPRALNSPGEPYVQLH